MGRDDTVDPDELRRLAHVARDEVEGEYFANEIADQLEAATDALELLRDEVEMYRDDFKSIFDLVDSYGGIDGGHHKQWVIDQIMRALLDEGLYEEWRDELREQGYEWSEGWRHD